MPVSSAQLLSVTKTLRWLARFEAEYLAHRRDCQGESCFPRSGFPSTRAVRDRSDLARYAKASPPRSGTTRPGCACLTPVRPADYSRIPHQFRIIMARTWLTWITDGSSTYSSMP